MCIYARSIAKTQTKENDETNNRREKTTKQTRDDNERERKTRETHKAKSVALTESRIWGES